MLKARAYDAVAAAGCLLVAGCYLAHERDVDASVDASTVATRPLVWVLVHPSDAPMEPGMFLFDEARQVIVRRLPLPDGVTSPHALAWDGRSLWLGGIDFEPGVREIDPMDGSVLSRWPGVVTEGIAVDGDTFWYAGVVATLTPLVQVTRDGTEIRSVRLDVPTVQDLVSVDGSLYYLINDGVDRIVRVDVATSTWTDLARDVHIAPYSLGFDGTHLAVAVDQRILRFDVRTGARVSEGPFAVPGWITAITFVR